MSANFAIFFSRPLTWINRNLRATRYHTNEAPLKSTLYFEGPYHSLVLSISPSVCSFLVCPFSWLLCLWEHLYVRHCIRNCLISNLHSGSNSNLCFPKVAAIFMMVLTIYHSFHLNSMQQCYFPLQYCLLQRLLKLHPHFKMVYLESVAMKVLIFLNSYLLLCFARRLPINPHRCLYLHSTIGHILHCAPSVYFAVIFSFSETLLVNCSVLPRINLSCVSH